MTPAPSETWKDYTVFDKVTWLGKGGPSDTPEGMDEVLSAKPSIELILPEMTLDWFREKSATLEALSQIITMLESQQPSGFLSSLRASCDGLDQLPELLSSLFEGDNERAELVQDQLWTYCKGLENEVNTEVEKAMNDAKLALSGAELLDALADGSGFQRRLKGSHWTCY